MESDTVKLICDSIYSATCITESQKGLHPMFTSDGIINIFEFLIFINMNPI